MGTGLLSNPPKDWFQAVSEGNVQGYSYINQIGKAPLVTTATDPADIWDGGGLYNFSTTANINKIASSDNTDTQTLLVTGLADGYIENTQYVVLTGQTVATLGTALIRITSILNLSSTNIAGTVYLATSVTAWTDGVPDTATEIRAEILNGHNKTQNAIYTIPANKIGYFWGGYSNLTATGFPKAGTARVSLRIRLYDGSFFLGNETTLIDTGTSYWQRQFPFPAQFSAKTDILARVDEVSDDIGVVSGFSVLLKDI